MHALRACLIIGLGTGTLTASAQSPQTPWDSVATILQAAGTATGGYHRYNLPRRDITLRIGDVTVAPHSRSAAGRASAESRRTRRSWATWC